jgi:phage shock protein C
MRIPERGVVGGVCAGIAEYFDWNVRLLRALLVVALIFSGAFPILVVYAVLWYVLDPAPPGAGSGAGFESGSRGATTPEVHERFARLDARLQRIEECVTDREFELRRELKKLET